ncbi:tail protein X [Methylobacterium indicum]|uniref:Tail protein n=1 Tax=Methylobacterium indicum TaxID=1775910 RepID=A0A8H8X0K2_9HYPH|nr:tail protein X [Methylobacterium indicum]BCM87893.1 hypothetical protein mvi_63540 [Methylobacterium indicum]
MREYVTRQFDRVDRIVFDAYGSDDDPLVAWFLEQNPGLERQPIVLPLGLKIKIPTLPKSVDTVPVIQNIKLWD